MSQLHRAKSLWWISLNVVFSIISVLYATTSINRWKAYALSSPSRGKKTSGFSASSHQLNKQLPWHKRTLSEISTVNDPSAFDSERDYYAYRSQLNKSSVSIDRATTEATRTSGCGRPILIENVLSEEQCQDCCDRLLNMADEVKVDLQEQSSIDQNTKIHTCIPLAQAIDVIMRQSNSKRAFFTFCEGLLEDYKNEDFEHFQQLVTAARERLFHSPKESSRGTPSSHDWFLDFPSNVKPTDALILAGAGATSTLHRDPMEWTGTSLCLEGTKIWRFIEPPPIMAHDPLAMNVPLNQQTNQSGSNRVSAVDEILRSYRLDSIAWESENNCGEKGNDDDSNSIYLSAGWQSDFSLYHHRKHEQIPSAKSLSELDDMREKTFRLKEASSLDILSPNIPMNACSTQLNIHTVIQKPGDILLIPAHWWHQTFALEPSVAIASQRCGWQDSELVFQHIFDRCQTRSMKSKVTKITPESLPQRDLYDSKKSIRDLFDHIV